MTTDTTELERAHAAAQVAADEAQQHADHLAALVADLEHRGAATAELEKAALVATVADLLNGGELPAARLAELAAQRAALAALVTTARAALPEAQRAARLAQADSLDAEAVLLLAQAEARRAVLDEGLAAAHANGVSGAALVVAARRADEATGRAYGLKAQAATLRRV